MNNGTHEMKMKPSRYYDITSDGVGNLTLNIYPHPNKAKAEFSSHVKVDDMQYYRNNFKLSKVWTQEEIERNELLERF